MGGEAGEIKNIGIFNFDQKEKRRNKDDILGGEKKKNLVKEIFNYFKLY